MESENKEGYERVLYGFWVSPYMALVAHVLEESGLSYRYERVSPFVGGTISDEHRARNPLQKIPTLQDSNGLVVSESQAICRYLGRTYPEAAKFYPCGDPVRCSEVDVVNDFLTFSISGPFFNWFVVGAYYPKAFRLKVERESHIFSSWSLINVKGAMVRLLAGAEMSPFLLGSEPTLPDFHLFHILELGNWFSQIFEMPVLNLVAGDSALEKFYAAMSARASSQKVMAAQSGEHALTEREIFEEFGDAYREVLTSAKPAFRALFGHDV